MSKYKRGFLDYYGEHGISPVAQDISNIQQHFERREALYRHCGIPSSFIRDRSVLEIGPGTGHNALYTNAMHPKDYTLLDGNPKSCDEVRKTLRSYYKDISNCEIVEADFNDFSSNKLYDLVLCEGTIPTQKNPGKFLEKVSSFVKPGGVLLITTVDANSFLSECLRRVLAQIVVFESGSNDLGDKLNILRPFFSPHLKTLKGMSRSVDDWIMDNMLQPYVGELMSIEEAIITLADVFDVYGSSPKYFLDWRWYKDIYGDSKNFNEIAILAYRRNIHNLLDYRHELEPVDQEKGIKIDTICRDIYVNHPQHQSNEINTKELARLLESLRELDILLKDISPVTSVSVREFLVALDGYLSKGELIFEPDYFQSWFGRGQQYLSFIKNVQ